MENSNSTLPSSLTQTPLVRHRDPCSPKTADLARQIGEAIDDGGPDVGRRIAMALGDAAVHTDIVSRDACQPSPKGYARRMLHADPRGRFTILAIVWAPGQHSPIHAHHTWCAYAVHSGVLAETLYRFDRLTSVAQVLRTYERCAGYACHGEACLDQIHRLGNCSDEVAVSIHVYGVDAANIATGVNRILPDGETQEN